MGRPSWRARAAAAAVLLASAGAALVVIDPALAGGLRPAEAARGVLPNGPPVATPSVSGLPLQPVVTPPVISTPTLSLTPIPIPVTPTPLRVSTPTLPVSTPTLPVSTPTLPVSTPTLPIGTPSPSLPTPTACAVCLPSPCSITGNCPTATPATPATPAPGGSAPGAGPSSPGPGGGSGSTTLDLRAPFGQAPVLPAVLDLAPVPVISTLSPVSGLSGGRGVVIWPILIVLNLVLAVAVLRVARRGWVEPEGATAGPRS